MSRLCNGLQPLRPLKRSALAYGQPWRPALERGQALAFASWRCRPCPPSRTAPVLKGSRRVDGRRRGRHTAKPGVHHRLVVGRPMLHALLVSGFGRLIAGGQGGGHGKGRDGKCNRSQSAKKNAFHGEPLHLTVSAERFSDQFQVGPAGLQPSLKAFAGLQALSVWIATASPFGRIGPKQFKYLRFCWKCLGAGSRIRDIIRD